MEKSVKQSAQFFFFVMSHLLTHYWGYSKYCNLCCYCQVGSSSSSMKGMSRSSKLPLVALLMSCDLPFAEEFALSWLGRKHMDWVASVCPGKNSADVNSLCSSHVWAIRLLTLCAKSGGFCGHAGFWVFRIVTFPSIRNVWLVNVYCMSLSYTHSQPQVPVLVSFTYRKANRNMLWIGLAIVMNIYSL